MARWLHDRKIADMDVALHRFIDHHFRPATRGAFSITPFLRYLLHWCDRNGVLFEEALERAEHKFLADVDPKDNR